MTGLSALGRSGIFDVPGKLSLEMASSSIVFPIKLFCQGTSELSHVMYNCMQSGKSRCSFGPTPKFFLVEFTALLQPFVFCQTAQCCPSIMLSFKSPIASGSSTDPTLEGPRLF